MTKSTTSVAQLREGDEDSGGDPAVARRLLGTRLRTLRVAAGLKGYDVGRAIGASHSKISRLESGLLGFRLPDLEKLLTLYGVADTARRTEYVDLARGANAPGHRHIDVAPRWYDTYLAFEDSATLLRSYSPGVVPELLQTPEYARELLDIAHPSAPDDTGHTELLEQRQRRLTGPDPLRLWVLLEQSVLRRQLGSTQVWRAQLEHLGRVGELVNVTIQIVPDHVCGPVLSAVPFALMRFGNPDLSDVVHLYHATGAQFLDRPGDLDVYHSIWDRLSVKALQPDRSIRIIEGVACGAAV
ncbi:helix-turn-helix domain-containing protein [Nocardia miyunensis]|uniref:helix-turn-helix domain-containing protein n=1 Tax=Nocardia miyunensis TaxID=282684 RepID=UPI000A02CE61|nr:helix-turn-helix transcriptional regulator [Nocardia miyunensis]